MTNSKSAHGPEHVLALERVIGTSPEKVWRCWTEPKLLEQWFCPKPWYVTDAVIDLRPGGEFSCVMNGPEGETFDNIGVFLEVDPQKRLVTTDAFRPGWDEAARVEHEQMGFHEGWGKAADQLEALARSL